MLGREKVKVVPRKDQLFRRNLIKKWKMVGERENNDRCS